MHRYDPKKQKHPRNQFTAGDREKKGLRTTVYSGAGFRLDGAVVYGGPNAINLRAYGRTIFDVSGLGRAPIIRVTRVRAPPACAAQLISALRNFFLFFPAIRALWGRLRGCRMIGLIFMSDGFEGIN